MQKRYIPPRIFSVPDIAILLLLATTIYAVVAVSQEWRTEFRPLTEIDLSVTALPYYVLLSAFRGVVAYFISLGFSLSVGYLAAKSKTAEQLIIPLLDVLQSIPVLGFLPGLLLGLVSLFPKTNTGLELAAIIMIFTGQVWNMTFGFYSSLKSIPKDLTEAATTIGFSRKQRFLRLELPYSAVNLAWNSLLSMAGGWFFLIPCEAITLGEKEYRLPGIGAYMDVAIKNGNARAMGLAILAMVSLIILMDFVIWRPILAWVQRFRLQDSAVTANTAPPEPLMQIWIRESKIVRWLKTVSRRWSERSSNPELSEEWEPTTPVASASRALRNLGTQIHLPTRLRHRVTQALEWAIGALILGLIGLGTFELLKILVHISPAAWVSLLRDTLWTFLRVMVTLVLSTLWAVPVGIWLATSSRRIRIGQPIIQVLASFPAPMLYPIVLGILFSLRMSFDWAAMFLMMLGVQWYVLFNVLAGAMRIPRELNDAMSLMKSSRLDRWRTLYLPSVFPDLVTGWVTAAGGAWNASVLAEYLFYRGNILKTAGLGASLSVSIANENFALFAGSLTLMVMVVVLLNRLVWSRILRLAQTRFKMEF